MRKKFYVCGRHALQANYIFLHDVTHRNKQPLIVVPSDCYTTTSRGTWHPIEQVSFIYSEWHLRTIPKWTELTYYGYHEITHWLLGDVSVLTAKLLSGACYSVLLTEISTFRVIAREPHQWKMNISSGCDSVPSDNKPLPGTMLSKLYDAILRH